MKLVVYSKDETVFDGYADTVTSFNTVGEFDILQEHANFISIIKQELILNKGKPTEKHLPLTDEAILKVSSNTVEVYV